MQDTILLGFLMDGPKTGYEIKKEMEGSTDMFFNTSHGSINPAFKKLKMNGLVTSEERIEKGRAKKEYTITDKGREYFHEWMNSKVQRTKIKREILLRVFFFSKIPKENRGKIIKQYLASIEKFLGRLKEIKKQVQVDQSLGEFEFDALTFGVDYYAFLVDWYREYARKLEESQ